MAPCIGNRFLQNIVQSVEEETGIWTHGSTDPRSSVFVNSLDGTSPEQSGSATQRNLPMNLGWKACKVTGLRLLTKTRVPNPCRFW